MDDQVYDQFHAWLESHVQGKNADLTEQTEAADGTVVPVATDGKISSDLELRFMLCRHWSLYESMYYSPFVASRLSVWKSNGRQQLHELLAKMGLSLEQCKQKWSFMSPQLRARLEEQMDVYGTEYGLEDFQYRSFQRCVGFKAVTSAADVVHAVTAVIESRPACRAHATPAADAGTSSEDPAGDDQQPWQEGFWQAYDALPGKSTRQLQQGLELSMRLQKAIVHEAVSMTEKRGYTCLKHFRYAYLTRSQSAATGGSSNGQDALLSQPNALAKLALFLVEIHRQNGKWVGPKARPLVILAERESTYLVVGVTCPEFAGESVKNFFGRAFQLAAEQINARFRHTSFDTAVMEIERDNVHRFIESLHVTMDYR